MTEKTAAASSRDQGPEKGGREEGLRPRGKWTNNREFLLAMSAGIIGFPHILHFPIQCLYNGGAAFFIPCLVILFFCGFPLMFLETSLGQFTSEGMVTAWRKISPMFQGIGGACQVVVFYMNTYFMVTLAWAILYLVYSFGSTLPWSTCDNWWNTVPCQSRFDIFTKPDTLHPDTNWFLNHTSFENFSYFNETDIGYQIEHSSEMQFFKHRILRISESLSVNHVPWDLALCLLAACLVRFLCTCMGIKVLGKVVYFSVTFPYLLLILLLFRGLTLPGAANGLHYYFYPDLHMLTDPMPWANAANYVFYSLALCMGILTTLGSYNEYNSNCYRDCLALCCLSSATAVLFGVTVASLMGFLAHELDASINDISSSGVIMIFVSFPTALSLLPARSFWVVVFFLMIFFFGMNNQLVYMESLATAVADMFPRRLRRPGVRPCLVLGLCGACFLLGLLFITEGGIYIFTLVDYYGLSDYIVLIICGLEAVVIGWVYGADRFYVNIEDMIGYPPFPVLKYCWMFVLPLLMGIKLLYKLSGEYFSLTVFDYKLGIEGAVIGTILFVIPLLCIPICMLVALCKNVDDMTVASGDLRQARPHKPQLTLCKKVIYPSQAPPPRSVDETNGERIMMEEPSGV